MSDRKMLEFAAKAAGIDYHATREDGTKCIHDGRGYWNPLTDDGDALRLAVKLGLHVSQQLSYVAAMRPHGGAGCRCLQWTEQYNDDPLAATRRAIVRAAAEIGRQMP